MKEKIVKEPIYKNGCWSCKKAREDLTGRYIRVDLLKKRSSYYVCPKLEEHWKEYREYEI